MKTTKNLISLLCVYFLFSAASCDNGNNEKEFRSCDLDGEKIIVVTDAEGILSLTDSISGIKVISVDYYIFLDSYENTPFTLPLQICNLPLEDFNFLKQGDTLRVRFSGRLEKLPPEVDALSEVFELNQIEVVSK